MPQAPLTPTISNLSWALHIDGYPEQARRRSIQSNELATQLRRPFSLAFANMYSIALGHFQREYADMRSRCEALIELSGEHGLTYWLASGKMCLARTLAGEGDFEGGLAMMKDAAASLAASGSELNYSFSFNLLAEVYLMMKRPDDCLRELDHEAERCERMDHRLLEAEIHRLRGEAILMRADNATEAERSFRRAIEIAVRQSARSWELRARRVWRVCSGGPGAARKAAQHFPGSMRNSRKDSTWPTFATRKRLSISSAAEQLQRSNHPAQALTQASEESSARDGGLRDDSELSLAACH